MKVCLFDLFTDSPFLQLYFSHPYVELDSGVLNSISFLYVQHGYSSEACSGGEGYGKNRIEGSGDPS